MALLFFSTAVGLSVSHTCSLLELTKKQDTEAKETQAIRSTNNAEDPAPRRHTAHQKITMTLAIRRPLSRPRSSLSKLTKGQPGVGGREWKGERGIGGGGCLSLSKGKPDNVFSLHHNITPTRSIIQLVLTAKLRLPSLFAARAPLRFDTKPSGGRGPKM